jgi:trimeric autotransporter adhesin
VPALSSLSPSSVFTDSGAFTLTVNGTGFVNGGTVQFNGANRVTTFVSGTQLTAAILASDVAAAATANVTVTNPAPTTGPSASLALNITNEGNPVPAISTLGTTHVTGGAAFTLTVNGSNFVASSVVNLNGKAEATTFVSATKISAAIPASDVAVAGSINVTVTNPTPGGGTSPAFTLFVDGFVVSGVSTAALASGQQAALPITVAPTGNGFANPITFTISGLPSGISASFNPTSVTPDAKPATTTLTISDGATAASRAKSQLGLFGGGITPRLLLLCVIALLAWVGFEMRGRSIPQMRRYATVGLFVFMLFAGSVLGGCALGVTSSPSHETSQLTVTATSGTMTQTFGVTLTVTR